MTFISYAQNFEDLVLWRALGSIECGFYIDVGANDPEVDSVTKAFYDRGWRGINIDPAPEWIERLNEERPRDINLQLAVGAEQGELLLFEIPGTGLSTTVRAIAETHETQRGYAVIERRVPEDTLTNICLKLHASPIHFLKIDIEGGEESALAGLDLRLIRPWVIVIESTKPLTPIECHVNWEHLLLNGGYSCAYFDGLNRYYLADEHSELSSSFSTPPNFFDHFLLSKNHWLCSLATEEARKAASEALALNDLLKETSGRAEQAAAEVSSLRQHTGVLEQRAILAEGRVIELVKASSILEANTRDQTQLIRDLETSRSWRITAPFRSAKELASRNFLRRNRNVRSIFISIARLGVGKISAFLTRHPALKANAITWLRRFPQAERRVRQLLSQRETHRTGDDQLEAATESAEALLRENSILNRRFDFSHKDPNEVLALVRRELRSTAEATYLGQRRANDHPDAEKKYEH